MGNTEKKGQGDLRTVRESLVKASKIKDPKTMWFFLRDVFNIFKFRMSY